MKAEKEVEATGMTKEEEFDLFIMDSFLYLYHIMESRMEAEEEQENERRTNED